MINKRLYTHKASRSDLETKNMFNKDEMIIKFASLVLKMDVKEVEKRVRGKEKKFDRLNTQLILSNKYCLE